MTAAERRSWLMIWSGSGSICRRDPALLVGGKCDWRASPTSLTKLTSVTSRRRNFLDVTQHWHFSLIICCFDSKHRFTKSFRSEGGRVPESDILECGHCAESYIRSLSLPAPTPTPHRTRGPLPSVLYSPSFRASKDWSTVCLGYSQQAINCTRLVYSAYNHRLPTGPSLLLYSLGCTVKRINLSQLSHGADNNTMQTQDIF